MSLEIFELLSSLTIFRFSGIKSIMLTVLNLSSIPLPQLYNNSKVKSIINLIYFQPFIIVKVNFILLLPDHFLYCFLLVFLFPNYFSHLFIHFNPNKISFISHFIRLSSTLFLRLMISSVFSINLYDLFKRYASCLFSIIKRFSFS